MRDLVQKQRPGPRHASDVVERYGDKAERREKAARKAAEGRRHAMAQWHAIVEMSDLASREGFTDVYDAWVENERHSYTVTAASAGVARAVSAGIMDEEAADHAVGCMWTVADTPKERGPGNPRTRRERDAAIADTVREIEEVWGLNARQACGVVEAALDMICKMPRKRGPKGLVFLTRATIARIYDKHPEKHQRHYTPAHAEAMRKHWIDELGFLFALTADAATADQLEKLVHEQPRGGSEEIRRELRQRRARRLRAWP
jgi:hypothetical protein